MTAELGDGRHGPVFHGIDTASGREVVIRTFLTSMTEDGRERFLDALARLCDLPLDHAAIASPLACGEVDGVPFLVHEFMPGLPLDEYLRQHQRCALSDVSLRVMHLAGAIDFAAAAGVLHGSLGPRDLLLEDDRTGIAGFGIAQALFEAGVEPRRPSAADDLYALAAMTYEMLVGERYEGGDVRPALESVPLGDDVDVDALSRTLAATLSADPAGWPASALQFAASLHDALLTPVGHAASEQEDQAVGGHVVPTPAALGSAASASTMEFEPPPGAPPGRAQPPAPARTVSHDRAAEAAPGLPLFDAPMRQAGPAFATIGSSEEADADIGLGREGPGIPLNPRGQRGPFVPPPKGSGRLMQLVTVASLLAAAVAVFLLLGQPSLFDEDSGQRATQEPASDDSATPTENDTRLGAPSDGSASPPQPDGGDAFTPAPVLSDGPIAERDVASVAGGDRQSAAAPPPAQDAFATRATPAEAAPASQPATAPPAPVSGASVVSPPPVRPAPELAARVPEVATSGRVLVRSDPPGAQVFIDDELRGQTPVAIRELTLGTHTITVVAPGLPRWRQEVTLTADQPAQSFEIRLGASARPVAPPPAVSGPAILEIESRPAGAQVWMDGRLVGSTPLQLSGVEEGSRALRLEMPGYRPWMTSVSVARGAHARVAASLEQ